MGRTDSEHLNIHKFTQTQIITYTIRIHIIHNSFIDKRMTKLDAFIERNLSNLVIGKNWKKIIFAECFRMLKNIYISEKSLTGTKSVQILFSLNQKKNLFIKNCFQKFM